MRDVFLSHAREDKDAAARPLAEALQARGHSVWFDEFELLPSDSLSRRIDEGLLNSTVGVVVLSRNFFRKEWPRRELDGLTARRTSGEANVIVPVWHGVTLDDVRTFSPSLADVVAANTSDGIDVVADLIERLLIRLQVESSAARRRVHRILFVALHREGGANEMLFYSSKDWSIPLVPAPALSEDHPDFANEQFIKTIMLDRIGLDASEWPTVEVTLLTGVKSSVVKRSRDPFKAQMTRYDFRIAWCWLPDDAATRFPRYRDLSPGEREHHALGFATLKEVKSVDGVEQANADVLHCLEEHFGGHLEIVPPNP